MTDAIRRLSWGRLLAGSAGQEVPAWLAEALADGLGGVVLFGSNIGDATGPARLTGELGAAAGRDVVIALDEEGGDVTRLDALDPCNPVILDAAVRHPDSVIVDTDRLAAGVPA
jgi:hypothetical protein